MTNQEKKEILQQYRLAEMEEQRLEHEIERWRSRAERMTAGYSKAPAGGADGRSMEHTLERLGELAVELTQQRDKLIWLRREIGAAIDTVPDARLRELLRLRYIEGHSFEQMAVRMGYSYKQICRLHGTALEKMSLNVQLEQ